MVDNTARENPKLLQEVSDLTNCANPTEEQQGNLVTLMQRWSHVFAKHDDDEDDFGRTYLVKLNTLRGCTTNQRKLSTSSSGNI